jgi:phosphatidylglycerophosphate synthase
VVTLVSASFSYAGIATIMLARPTVAVGVGVTLLLVAGHALDAADGQLARLRGGGSVSGEWLDHMLDAIKISSLHLAVLISFYRFGDQHERWMLVPLSYTVVGAVSFFAQILNEQLSHNRGSTGSVQALSKASAVVSLLKIPTDYGLLCLSFLLLAASDLFLVAYATMFVGSAGYLALALIKWFADMRALDRVVST